jgi:hypothetical protein
LLVTPILGVKAPEVGVNSFVGVDAEELADDLYGQDFGVGKLGGRSSLANTVTLYPVAYEAEDRDDEGAKIHERRPPLRRLFRASPSVRRSPLSRKPSEKLAHRVNLA